MRSIWIVYGNLTVTSATRAASFKGLGDEMCKHGHQWFVLRGGLLYGKDIHLW